MNININNISLLTFARCTRRSFCVTIGLLYGPDQSVIPANQALPWLARRFAGQPFDRGLKKNTGTFAVHGTAYPLTRSHKTSGMTLHMQAGETEKKLYVFPPRKWQNGLSGWTPQISGELTPLCIDMHHAFGGKYLPDNPDGVGYESDPDKWAGMPLSQIESEISTSTPDQPRTVACFLPLPPQCTQRQQFWGTTDDNWLLSRAPCPPADSDLRWFNEVAEDQVAADYWKGNEYWQVTGMHPQSECVNGFLPAFRPRLFIQRHALNVTEEQPLDLDTIWFFPDEEHVLLLYRSELAVTDPDGEDIARLGAVCEYQSVDAKPAADWINSLWPVTLSPLPAETTSSPSSPVEKPDIKLSQQKWHEFLKKCYAAHNTAGNDIIEKINILLKNNGLSPLPDLSPPPDLSTKKTGIAISTTKPGTEKTPFNAGMELATSLIQRHKDNVARHLKISPGQLEKKISQLNNTSAPSLRAILLQHDNIPSSVLNNTFIQELMKASDKIRMPQSTPAPPIKTTPEKKHQPSVDITWTRESLVCAISPQDPLSGQYFTDLDLSNTDFSHTVLSRCLFKNCQLTDATLKYVRFSECTFQDCDFNNADFSFSIFEGTIFQSCGLEKVCFSQSTARKMMMRDCRLINADMTECHWLQAVLVNCNLTNAKARKAVFTSSCMNTCNLSAMILNDACLNKVVMENCQLDNTCMVRAELYASAWSGCTGQKIDMSFAQASDIRMERGCVLPDINLSHAMLSNASLRNIQLPGSCLRFACLDHALLLCCELINSDGYHLTARGTNFTGCDLSRASWLGANLHSASLRKTVLDNTDLSGSNLHAVDGDGARGKDTKLKDALMTRSRLSEELNHV